MKKSCLVAVITVLAAVAGALAAVAVYLHRREKELDEYEKNVLYPLSTERIEIDLDDGVKANYKKFGTALRKVAALEERSAE